MKRSRGEGSYDDIVLRKSNVKYVSQVTGKSIKHLETILEVNEQRGLFSVKIPLGPAYFTRYER